MAAAPRSGRRRFAYSRLVFGKAGHRAPEKRLVSLSEAHIAAVAAAHIGAPDGVLAGVIAVRTARRARAAIAGVAAITRGAGAGRAVGGRAFAGTRLAGAGRAEHLPEARYEWQELHIGNLVDMFSGVGPCLIVCPRRLRVRQKHLLSEEKTAIMCIFA